MPGCSIVRAGGHAFVPAGFVPERKLDPIPESEFVVDETQVVFHHMLGRADHCGDFAVLESPSDEFDDLLLAWAGDAGSVETACGHGRTRFVEMHSELRTSATC